MTFGPLTAKSIPPSAQASVRLSMKETDLKIIVVRWLLEQLEPGEIIASELQFADATARADLVVVSHTRLSAFEIKSSYDDFRRFERQQEAYRRAFLDSYLVIPTTLLKQAREHLVRTTGIITVTDEGSIRLQRQAQRRLQLTRHEALRWLRASDRRTLESAKMRDAEVTRVALTNIYKRLAPRFNIFLNERGTNVNSDDLGMLSLATRIR